MMGYKILVDTYSCTNINRQYSARRPVKTNLGLEQYHLTGEPFATRPPNSPTGGQNLRSVGWLTLLNCLPLLSRVARQQDSAIQTNCHSLIANERDICYFAARYLFHLLPLSQVVLASHLSDWP